MRSAQTAIFCILLGALWSGAFLVYEGHSWTVYVEPHSDDDALWHGPRPSCSDWTDRLGLPVQTWDQMKLPRDAMVLPCMHEATNRLISDAIGRTIQTGVQSPFDQPLALAMVQLRSVHDALAISELREAAEATAAAHHAARSAIQPGKTCHEVWAAMQFEFTKRGMTAAYQPIITPHGEVLHSHSLDEALREGDLVLIDVGAETSGGWAGDVTRTWPVSGQLSSTPERHRPNGYRSPASGHRSDSTGCCLCGRSHSSLHCFG